jgi:hypothetical protein
MNNNNNNKEEKLGIKLCQNIHRISWEAEIGVRCAVI